MATPQERDPITCHVLDTTTGRPATGIHVRLLCLGDGDPDQYFKSETDSDGRILNWSNGDDRTLDFIKENGGVPGAIKQLIGESATPAQTSDCPKGASLWKLEFDTGAYYGVRNTFFPKVELTFVVKGGEHFHVPLLLGPYSFTTYRGS